MSVVAAKNIHRALTSIAQSERGRKIYYYQPHFLRFEGDSLDPDFGELSEDEKATIDHLIEWGHVCLREVDDGHHEDDAPDGRTGMISLSRSGYDLYIEHSVPWYQKAFLNIAANFWSIATAVLISWALYYLGAPSQ